MAHGGLLAGAGRTSTNSRVANRKLSRTLTKRPASARFENLRHQVEQTLGMIDILVANAGGSFTMPGPLEEISEQGWHAPVDGNLTATFLTIKSFLPGMKERKLA